MCFFFFYFHVGWSLRLGDKSSCILNLSPCFNAPQGLLNHFRGITIKKKKRKKGGTRLKTCLRTSAVCACTGCSLGFTLGSHCCGECPSFKGSLCSPSNPIQFHFPRMAQCSAAEWAQPGSNRDKEAWSSQLCKQWVSVWECSKKSTSAARHQEVQKSQQPITFPGLPPVPLRQP